MSRKIVTDCDYCHLSHSEDLGEFADRFLREYSWEYPIRVSTLLKSSKPEGWVNKDTLIFCSDCCMAKYILEVEHACDTVEEPKNTKANNGRFWRK